MSHKQSNQYEVYYDELKSLSKQPNNFFERVVYKLSRKLTDSQNISYTVKVPASDYLRGELICEDVEEEIEEDFEQIDLMMLLLEDFLQQIIKKNNPIDIYKVLEHMDYQIISIYSNGKVEKVTCQNKNIKLICSIKRKYILRLEVILSDIANLNPQRIFKVEDVLRILYCDFIAKYRNGKLKNVLKSIVSRIDKQ